MPKSILWIISISVISYLNFASAHSEVAGAEPETVSQQTRSCNDSMTPELKDKITKQLDSPGYKQARDKILKAHGFSQKGEIKGVSVYKRCEADGKCIEHFIVTVPASRASRKKGDPSLEVESVYLVETVDGKLGAITESKLHTTAGKKAEIWDSKSLFNQ